MGKPIVVDLKELDCTCSNCLKMLRESGIIVVNENQPKSKPVQQNNFGNPKYAVYAVGHIINLLKIIANLNRPGKMTPFLSLYQKWVAAENDGRNPAFT